MNSGESDGGRPQAVAGVAADAHSPTVRKRTSRRWLWLAVPIGLVALFYGGVGYWGSGLMIGENPRWRGLNRGPQDFGLQSETVSFSATDGVPLKAWCLSAPTALVAP
jgi:hypothetical protein